MKYKTLIEQRNKLLSLVKVNLSRLESRLGEEDLEEPDLKMILLSRQAIKEIEENNPEK